ncbi:MAG: type II secretion system protein [Candidatus Shapirobacteria bacterium]
MIKKINKKNGFTLIELLIVISIMGILTVIVASSFYGSQQKSRDAARKANLKSVADALNMYYGDFGSYPDNVGININTLMGSQGEFSVGSVIYMKKMPGETVSSMRPFLYEVSGTSKSFRLYANLENEKDKDCHLKDNCPSYNSFTTGCCYVITSSNANLDSLP